MRNIATVGMMLLMLCLVQNVEAKTVLTGGVTGSGWLPVGVIPPTLAEIAAADAVAEAEVVLDYFIGMFEQSEQSSLVTYFYTQNTMDVINHPSGVEYRYKMHNVALILANGAV